MSFQAEELLRAALKLTDPGSDDDYDDWYPPRRNDADHDSSAPSETAPESGAAKHLLREVLIYYFHVIIVNLYDESGWSKMTSDKNLAD